MLQQTRVEQTISYFERFVDQFPSVHALAKANREEVLKAWEGLGYYARARNMHDTAKKIIDEHGGSIPNTQSELLGLPGIGPYTSAAILSIAFGQPFAVLDGNVIRVLTRVFGIEEDTRSSKTRKALQQVADHVLNRTHPGDHNEALMELGATLCTPSIPSCERCPVSSTCYAFQNQAVERLPFTSRRKPVPHIHIAVGILRNEDGSIFVQKRPESSMLGGLWEFPGGKLEPNESPQEACRRELSEELGIEATIGEEIIAVKHTYSHFTITLHAFQCTSYRGTPSHFNNQPVQWVAQEKLDSLPFPRANQKIIEALHDSNK